MSKQTKPEICECKYPTYEAGTVTCIKCNKTIPTPEPFHKPEQDVVSNRIALLEGLLRESIRCLDTTIDTQRHNAVSPDSLANKIRKTLKVKDDS